MVSTANANGACLSTFSIHRCGPGHVLCVTRRRRVLGGTQRSCRGILYYASSRLKLFSKADGRRSHGCIFTAIRAVSQPRVLARFDGSSFSCVLVSRIRRTTTSSCGEVVSCFAPSFVLNVATAPRHASNTGVFRLFNGGITCRVHLRRTLRRSVLYPFRCCKINRCVGRTPSNGFVKRRISTSSVASGSHARFSH